jgi:hypothetical protein
MTLAEFKQSQARPRPSVDLSVALTALWWAGKDDWDKAHKIVMDEADKDCAWVHAYLHRVEGDADNAGYWYRQAGKVAASGALETEYESIAQALLSVEQ